MAPSFDVRDHTGWTVVTVTGEIDVYTAPRLREELIDVIADGCRRLVVDMNAVTFIDSTGLGVLVGALKRMRTVSGEMHVVAGHEPVLRTMRVTGLHRVFGTYETVADASSSGNGGTLQRQQSRSRTSTTR